jgi:GxxExxY protein
MRGDLVMEWEGDELTRRIISCLIRVHQTLGPGFLEGIYKNALAKELRRSGLAFEVEREIAITYEGDEVGRYRLDLLVEGRVIVELKAVDELSRAHYAQLRAYLKAAGLRRGLLVNFSKPMADCRRVELA